MTPDVSLTMIVRDVAHLLPACLESAAPAVDEVILVDTGSRDATVDAASRTLSRFGIPLEVVDCSPRARPDLFLEDSEALGKELGLPGPYSGLMMLSDYGAARQAGWDRCNGRAIMWLDSDDELEDAGAVRDVAAAVVAEGLGAAMIRYDYSRDAEGRTTCMLRRERIARQGGRWAGAIHEVLIPDGPTRPFDRPLVVHRRRGAGGPAIAHRNLKIMLRQLAAVRARGEPADPRLLFYLSSELRYFDPGRAREHLEEYCSRSGWQQERALARLWLGEIAEREQAWDRAFVEFAASVAEDPDCPDGHLGLLRALYMKQRWHEAAHHGMRGWELASQERQWEVLQHDPTARRTVSPRYLVPVLINAGRLEEAREIAAAAAPKDPDPQQRKNLEHNLAFCEGLIRERQAPRALPVPEPRPRHEVGEPAASESPADHPPPPAWVLALMAVEAWRHVMAEGDAARATSLLRSLPTSVAGQVAVRAAIGYSSTMRLRRGGGATSWR